MRAIVWKGGQEFVLEDVADPLRHGQVVVKIEAATICGSDMHLADFGCKPPIVVGHEGAGIVAEIGEGVALKCGDRVALDPVQVCGSCWPCRNALRHLCSNVRHLGMPKAPGTWAEYVLIDAANAHRMPDDLSMDAASLTEPVAVCYESFRRSAFQPGQSVLIVGDGPFGFLHAQLARATGAGKLILAGHCDAKLARIARQTGAITCNNSRDDPGALLADVVGAPGLDVAFECSGSTAGPNICLRALRPRGTAVMFSYVWKPEPSDLGRIHMRELSVVGSCRSLDAFDRCLEMMSQGLVDTSQLIDLRLPLGQVRMALDELHQRKAEIFKAVLYPAESQ